MTSASARSSRCSAGNRARCARGQTGDADELFEIAGNELRALIRDDSRFGVGIFFHAALQDDFDVGLDHSLAQFPVYDCARAAVEQRAEVEEVPEILMEQWEGQKRFPISYWPDPKKVDVTELEFCSKRSRT